MLEPGDPAPGVSAPNQRGETVSPSFEGVSVRYFYPEDGTPGCTTEAAQFVAERAVYEEAGVAVYGVSTDSVASTGRSPTSRTCGSTCSPTRTARSPGRSA